MNNLEWKYKGKLGDIWNQWSKTAAVAENHAAGTEQEESAWTRADEIWNEYQAAVSDYEATMDAASNRGGYG